MLQTLLLWPVVYGCTNILVTPSASADGSVLLGDNDDAASRHGMVTHFDGADHAPGSVRQVYDFESGRWLGEIPQPSHTHSTISHANDQGVVIAETTHGGLDVLSQVGKDYRNGTIMDYGSLIITTLQRSSTAREAVNTMVDLCNTYGYASSMEGFSITDGREAWYLELTGKGKWGTGVIWVALRVPDGYVTANANQARITTFLPCNDPSTCMAAPDVVSFAVEHGLFKGDPNDPNFSFSDVYDPVTATGARFCEARVWYIFSQIADPADFNATYYLPYAQGFNLTRRMPLWVRPREKLTRETIHNLLSSAYEGSWLDPALDIGAGAEHSPKRWNGLSWSLGGKPYVNERIVGTQFTAWHFVASVSPNKPPPMRALLWWGADEHGVAPKVPLFGGVTAVDRTYDDGNCSARLACRQELGLPGSMLSFSWESAFWINSAVARLAYANADRGMPLVRLARDSFEDWLADKLANAEAKALQQFQAGDRAGGLATLDQLALEGTREASSRWMQLWQTLMVSLQDGLSASVDSSNLLCGCKKTTPQFSQAWLAKVVADTEDRYRLPASDCVYIDPDGHCHSKPPTIDADGFKPISKLAVPGVVL